MTNPSSNYINNANYRYSLYPKYYTIIGMSNGIKQLIKDKQFSVQITDSCGVQEFLDNMGDVHINQRYHKHVDRDTGEMTKCCDYLFINSNNKITNGDSKMKETLKKVNIEEVKDIKTTDMVKLKAIGQGDVVIIDTNTTLGARK